MWVCLTSVFKFANCSFSRTNVEVFKIVLNIQDIITRIPGQVEGEKPVYLVDAIGRSTQFHLNFIMSAESLVSVLKNNLRDICPAADMIENGEFVLQDSSSNIDIDLRQPWEVCFTPGQMVFMSMVFGDNLKLSQHCCPKCGLYRVDKNKINNGDMDKECTRCKLIFRHDIVKFQHIRTHDTTLPRMTWKQGELRQYNEEDIKLFRRIRLAFGVYTRKKKSSWRYGNEEMWSCCMCDTIGAPLHILNDFCPGCSHQRCRHCQLE